MGRISRKKLLYDGCFAHVFTRSIEKKYIFESEEDFLKIKSFLLKSKKAYPYKIHHYCIMNTHIHLAVSLSKADQFSEAMKWIKNEYTRYYNGKHKRRGPLWQNRFKSLLIENERYLTACGLYIENNPVEVGLVERREDWCHSFARYYEEDAEDVIVDRYQVESNVEYEEIEDSLLKGSAIGSSFFKYQVKNGELPVPK